MTELDKQLTKEIFLEADNEAVIKHMDMYQGIITRMAGNSAACKTWGIPLVAALLGFMIEGKNESLVILAIITTLVFYYLDSYYLMLENRFRDGFSDSAAKIQAGKFKQSHLYKMLPMGSEQVHWKNAFTSIATWPVYLGLVLLMIFGYYAVV